MKESDLYEPIKEYFEVRHYEVYAEVIVPFSGGRVDMIAYSYPAAIAIELKTSLTIDLIEQAMDRKAVFPLVYIGIPYRRKNMASWLYRYLTEQGIGVIEVDAYGEIARVRTAKYRRPWFHNHPKTKNLKRFPIEKYLKEQHKTWVPGGHDGGGYVTDYRITMVGVKNFLYKAKLMGMQEPYRDTKEGWRSVAEILEHCETHYSTPKNSLAKALIEFEGDWVETKKEGRKRLFRMKGE